MTKKELRKTYMRKRLELTEEAYRLRNDKLTARLFADVDFAGIAVLHTFLPIGKNREVDTWKIIDRVQREFPEIRICIPKINNQTSELEHYYYEGKEQLEKNTWEIPEPIKGVPAAVEKIDAVLVPLLAFDKKGHRLGYGRGFYDRFLARCRRDCLKIGLSLFETEEEIDDIGEKDVPLDRVITPEKVFDFNDLVE